MLVNGKIGVINYEIEERTKATRLSLTGKQGRKVLRRAEICIEGRPLPLIFRVQNC
jgi:hypothetical protein